MTREQVKNAIPDITDEALKAILDIHTTDIGNIKKEIETLKAEKTQLESQIAEKDTTISNLEKANGDVEKIQKELESYKLADEERKKTEQDALETKAVLDAITGHLKDKQFVNDITRDSYVSKVREALTNPENKGKSAGDILDAMTKDVDGVFKNPNSGVKIPPVGGGAGSYTREQIKGMTPDEINKNWESIKESLKGM